LNALLVVQRARSKGEGLVCPRAGAAKDAFVDFVSFIIFVEFVSCFFPQHCLSFVWVTSGAHATPRRKERVLCGLN